MGDWIALTMIALVLLSPLAWRVWKDRQEERALTVRADIQGIVDHCLHGQSLVSVWVTAGSLRRPGRIELSVPSGWEPLLAEVWSPVLARVPEGYELVTMPPRGLRPESRPEPETLRRAA